MTTAYHSSRPDKTRGLNGSNPDNTPGHGDYVETPDLPVRGRLIDQVTAKLRSLHYALSTEKAYRQWILRFLRYHRRGGEWRHPSKMGKAEIEEFLTSLALERKVTAKTQNQAFSAILFLYKHVLQIELPKIDALRARESQRLPVVLSPQEVAIVIQRVAGREGLFSSIQRDFARVALSYWASYLLLL